MRLEPGFGFGSRKLMLGFGFQFPVSVADKNGTKINMGTVQVRLTALAMFARMKVVNDTWSYST